MKKFVSLLICVGFLCSVSFLPANAYKPTFKNHADAILLYNTDTDTVVYSQNPDKRVYPASLTKIMVAILLVEKVDNLEDLTLTVSEEIYLRYRYSEAVTAGFETGDKVNGHDLLAYTMVKSCADAAGVIAEYIAGSEAAFVDMMNAKAKELGMTSTNFTNCHGLHDENHYSTARDMCILTKYALKYSLITDIAKVARYETVDGITLAATNLLIDPSSGYYYKYATGFKTGYTNEAGRCLASTASYEGINYICIMLGCPPQEDSLENRYEFIDTAELYRWAFTEFTYRQILEESETVDSIPIKYSWDYDTVNVRPSKDIYALVPVNADQSTFKVSVDFMQEELEAPIKQGTVVGQVNVYYADQKVGAANAVVAESVEGSQILRTTSAIGDFLNKYKSIFFIIVLVVVVLLIVFIAVTIRLNSKKKKYGTVRKYKRF